MLKAKHNVLDIVKYIVMLSLLVTSLGCSEINQEMDKNKTTQDPIKLSYKCDNGKMLKAIYINSAAKQSASIQYDGKTIDMYSTVAASGAKYASETGLVDGEGLIWWTHDDEGMLQSMILDHTVSADDYPIIAQCIALY